MSTKKEIEKAKASELFNIHQNKVNSIQDTYCTHFDNLELRYQEGWLEVARHVLDNSHLNGLEYTSLYSTESFGGHGGFGLKISVAATPSLPDLKQKAISSAVYRAEETISAEIKAAIIAADPKSKKRTEAEKQQLLGLFPDKIFHEAIPNGYCPDYCCRHLPWYDVTTHMGRFTIGWRKRVIQIDWSRTVNTKTAKELFPDENVTKGDKLIHAHSIEDAKQYIDTILKN